MSGKLNLRNMEGACCANMYFSRARASSAKVCRRVGCRSKLRHWPPGTDRASYVPSFLFFLNPFTKGQGPAPNTGRPPLEVSILGTGQGRIAA